MKKHIFLILIFLFSSFNFFACSCSPNSLDASYLNSDFVAKIKILKKYKNTENNDFYKVDIKILDLYKGNHISSIYIYGDSEQPQDSACWIYTDVDDELIVYANKDDQVKIGACSRILILDNGKTYKFERVYSDEGRFVSEIKVLSALKKYNIEYVNNGKLNFDINCFLRLVNIDLINNDLPITKNDLAIYEFTLNSDNGIKKVKTLQGFNKKIDRRIKKIIKQQKWGNDFFKSNGFSKGTKSFITIYYEKSHNGVSYLRCKSM